MLTAVAVFLVLFGMVGAAVPVPYLAQVPGPTYNTIGEHEGEPVIAIEGREPDEVRGDLNLTTVKILGYRRFSGPPSTRLTLVQAVRGWLDPETSVVPEEAVYPPGRTREEIRVANREAFLSSEQLAEMVALGRLGYPVKVVVQGLAEDSPSEGLLEEGDAIEAVDGQPTPDEETLTAVLTAIPGGSSVTVSYTRLGRSGTATVTTRRAEDRKGSLLGISILEQPSAPFDVDVRVEEVGGPSAGLMLTLGMLELLREDDLTGGAVVAGTGTIDMDGAVGPIGGIALKMVAAEEVGAQVFLVPAGNCAAALAAPDPGFPLARVATLDDALEALADIRAGRAPAGC